MPAADVIGRWSDDSISATRRETKAATWWTFAVAPIEPSILRAIGHRAGCHIIGNDHNDATMMGDGLIMIHTLTVGRALRMPHGGTISLTLPPRSTTSMHKPELCFWHNERDSGVSIPGDEFNFSTRQTQADGRRRRRMPPHYRLRHWRNECAVSRIHDGALVEITRIPTGDFEATFDLLVEAARPFVTSTTTFGISCGGPLDARRGVIVSPPNLSTNWHGVAICAKLSATLGGGHARLMNDANACALAEWQFGAGRGCEHMVFRTSVEIRVWVPV